MALAFKLFSVLPSYTSPEIQRLRLVCVFSAQIHTFCAHACHGVLCVNDDVSTWRRVRTFPWLDTEILNSFFFCVSDKLGARFLSTFTHTCFFSFSFLHQYSAALSALPTLSLIAFLQSCCEVGLVCIQANPLMLNVSHQPLRPHGFHRRLPVRPVVVVCA